MSPIFKVSSPAPRTYVILSWISCVFCFPIGLVAVIKAHEADRYLMNGDFDGARRSAQVNHDTWTVQFSL